MNRVLKEGIYRSKQKLLIIAKANAKKIKPAHKKAQYGTRPLGRVKGRLSKRKEEKSELSHGSGSQNLPPHRHEHICSLSLSLSLSLTHTHTHPTHDHQHEHEKMTKVKRNCV
jgi:hypothetical protein